MAKPTHCGFEPGIVISAADVERINAGCGQIKQSQSRGIANLRYVHDAAWQTGYREGLGRAMTELAAFHDSMAEYRRGGSSPVTEIVFAVVRKILGDIEPGTLAAQVADKAIAECTEKLDVVVVHTHPDAVATVAENLEKFSRASDGVRFEVRADDRLAPTGCELHTAFGIIEASVDMQLDALESHIGAANRD